MEKTIEETFNEIQAFKIENPEQTRSGCLFQQNADGQTLKNYTIENEIFKDCSFYTAKLINCKFIKCTFLNCNLSFMRTYSGYFKECEFHNCNFSYAIIADTPFINCTKNNCNLLNIHTSGLTKGISVKDQNIIQDQESLKNNIVEEEDTLKNTNQEFNLKLTQIMNKHFPNWIQDDNDINDLSFTLSDETQKTGFVLYADTEKNSTDTDNFWLLSFFFNNVAILTTDINMFNLTDEEIINQINTWKNEILKDNAETLITRIIEILEQ